MKVHVLTAAVLAAFASTAALAASEGGDTWSAVQPVQELTYSVMQSAEHVDPQALVPDAAFEASESGDTWSSLQALRQTAVQQVSVQRRPGRTDTGYAGLPGGSEGGDTWSRFVPQPQDQSMPAAGVASGPRFEQR